MDKADKPLIIDGEPVLTVEQVAKTLGINQVTVRDAIKAGELKAFIPFGRDKMRTGPGLGYRVKRSEMQRWYFGE